MKYIISFLIVFITTFSFAQKEFHVFPIDGKNIKGIPNGDGSIKSPWDLQTALSQTSERVNGDDIIWLHEGVYKGSFRSVLSSTNVNKHITVSAYKNDKVILNGNKPESKNYVLEVYGDRVIYKNFEITFLGDFSRVYSEKDFRPSVGINHSNGEDCKFQNLIIHNIPGSGIGSWKATAGSIIEDCVIYNNGYTSNRGHGVGLYVQNQSDKTRLIRNNIIFNNYYKGIEVWSATSGSKREFVKNITLTDNIIFNNGVPVGKPRDNLIIASGDTEGINVAKNIRVRDNVFYHNIDFKDRKNHGYGNSITLGYSAKALVEAVSITDNYILGRNNGLNIMHAKSLEFKNNTIYTGFVHFDKSTLLALESGRINFDNNVFHTRNEAGLRILKHKDFKLSDFKKKFNIKDNNEWKSLSAFNANSMLNIVRLKSNANHFNIALLDKNGDDITVDFSNENIAKGTAYKIYDIENREVVIKSGEISSDLKIEFPMGLEAYQMPLHNAVSIKSAKNFGVFRIEFEAKEKRKTFFGRFFDWLF